MDAQSVAPLELDPVVLPPIPCPLPTDFFDNIPSDAPAIFSTLSGQRPPRALQTPIPVHLVQEGGGTRDDMDKKAWSIMEEYPELSESVMTPPVNWKDMYNYFDAIDLWKEGPGFLFHVVGFIYRVNITRFNTIQSYVKDWVSRNEDRIMKIPTTEDILCHLITDEDRAFFDFDNMTNAETWTLRSALMWHRDGLYRRQESLHLAQINDAKIRGFIDPSIVSMQLQRPCGSVPVNPRVPSPINTYMRQVVDHSATNTIPAHSRSNSYYLNGDYNQSHQNPMRNAYFGAVTGAENTIPQFVGGQNYSHIPPEVPCNPRGGVCGPPYFEQFGRQQIGFPGFNAPNAPVYVFNPQKPVGGYSGQDLAAGPPRQDCMPYRGPEIPFVPVRDTPGFVTQASRPPIKYNGVSNDARRHYNPELNRRWESPPQKMEPMVSNHPNQYTHRSHWSRDGFPQACTVFVGGFLTYERNTDWVPKLLSECGRIVKFKPLGGTKNSGFVTFDNVESTSRAIELFNGFETFEGLRLTVSHPRPRSPNDSYSSQNSSEMNRVSSRSWSQESPPVRNRDRQYSNSRNSGQTWSHSRNGSSHTTPPKYRSPVESRVNMATVKENGNITERGPNHQAAWHSGTKLAPVEDCFQAQLDTVAKATSYNAGFNDTTPRAPVESGEFSGRTGDGRRGTIKKRKTWSKSGFSGATPTQSPKKSPKSGSRTIGGVKKDGVRDSIETTPTKSKCGSRVNSQSTSDVSPLGGPGQSPASSVSGVMGVQHKSLSPVLSKNVESEQVTENHNNAVSHQPLQSEGCARDDEVAQDCATTSTSSLQPSDTMSSDKLASTDNLVKLSFSSEAPNEMVSTPKRKKNSKRFSRGSKGSKGSIEEESLPAVIVRIPTDQSVGEKSDGSFSHTSDDTGTVISHLRSDSSTTAMSVLSSEEIPFKVESEAVEDGRAVKSEVSLAENISAAKLPSNQITKHARTDRPSSSDDVFSDNKKPAAEAASKLRGRHKKANSGSSGGSSARKYDSETVNSRNRNQDGSPTPCKKAKPGSQKRESVKKAAESSRKENERKQLTQMLSDLSHWPKIGETPQVDLKPDSHQRKVSGGRSHVERMSTPGLPRSGSSASIVSESPHNTRGQTIDSPGTPNLYGSELWPGVKRWDLEYRSRSNSKSATESTNNE